MQFEEGFRADLVVENKVIAELKSVESVTKSQEADLDSPETSHKKLGFLLNFGAAVMKDGITRTVNGLDEGR